MLKALPLYHVILGLSVNTVLWAEDCRKSAVGTLKKQISNMVKFSGDTWSMTQNSHSFALKF
jgi:hypothetical protein